MLAKKVMTSMYDKAMCPNDLPWHQAEPPSILVDAVRARPTGGRALDVGCGAGTFSVYLAKHGFEVTGIDMIPRALELAETHARAAGVDVKLVTADVLGGSTARYRDRLYSWLAPGGDFVLGHWARRHALDWRPMGPRRRTKRELVELFAPELHEHTYVEELMTNVPLPFGPTVLSLGIWFKRLAAGEISPRPPHTSWSRDRRSSPD